MVVLTGGAAMAATAAMERVAIRWAVGVMPILDRRCRRDRLASGNE